MDLFLWFAVLFGIATLFFGFYLPGRGRGRIHNKKLAPEAGGGWPLIGHLPLLSGPELPHITLSNMADKYGPIFSIRLGKRRGLVVSSWEIAKECFNTNDKIFSNRPKTAAIEHMGYNFAMFGFNAYGPYWREVRKIVMLKLLTNQRVAMLGNKFLVEVRALMRSLYGSCAKNEENAPVDMNKIFEELTLNLMVRLVLGDIENKELYEGERWREATKQFFRLMDTLTISDMLPFLKWLDYFTGTTKTFKRTAQEMDSVLQAWLDENRKRAKNVCEPEKCEGIMGEMMASADRVAEEFPVYGADTINKATCQGIMLGGTSTMAGTLTWAVCLLLNNRHTLKRAQEEVDIHVGRERPVQESDMENLVYTGAIIKETLRICPLPLLAPRESVADCTVGGYHVPAGTRLIVNAWKLQRDPRVWSDPLEFQPERFLTNHKEVDVRGLHFELLPFGSGRRVCPGISFALSVMELALASLLHGFDIETLTDEPVDMTGSLGSTNAKATALEVLLKPRLSFNVYG